MRIYVPFRSLKAETYLRLATIAKLIPLLDDKDYARYLRDRWLKGQTFINVEHDIVPTLDQLSELWDCPKPWCACAYDSNNDLPFLGCAKFSQEFIKRYPNLWDELPYWTYCDQHLFHHVKEPFHLHSKVEHIKRSSVLTHET